MKFRKFDSRVNDSGGWLPLEMQKKPVTGFLLPFSNRNGISKDVHDDSEGTD
jgi:hypothetical protein